MRYVDTVELDDLICIEDAAELARVKVDTVENWIRAGRVEWLGLDERGRRLYWAREVLNAEAATRRSERGRPRKT